MTIYDTVESPGKAWVHVSVDSPSRDRQQPNLLFLFEKAPYAYRISGWEDIRS
jgi:hypothetical protein